MNNLVRPRQFAQGGSPAIGERSGAFVWNGATWVPSPCDCDDTPGFPCPPPGFPPPGCPPWFSGANSPPWYPGANAGVSFGTTSPPNPVRGHFWWDGVSLWLFDGAAWDVVGATGGGSTTPPSNNPPANPAPGEQWFNGSTLFIWDGNAWVPVSQTKTYIQATAPVAPNPGDTWFDGTQFRVWDGSGWELVGPGATVGPVPTTTQVFAMLSANVPGVSTTPNGNWSIVPFVSTPSIDTQGAYDGATQRITPKVGGNYLWSIRAWKNGNQTEAGAALVRNDNGSFSGATPAGGTVAIADDASGAGTGIFMQSTGMAHMNGTTDFVRLWGVAAPDGLFNTIANISVIEAWLMP